MPGTGKQEKFQAILFVPKGGMRQFLGLIQIWVGVSTGSTMPGLKKLIFFSLFFPQVGEQKVSSNCENFMEISQENFKGSNYQRLKPMVWVGKENPIPTLLQPGL